jgi:predicted transcriptional regulator
MIRTQIQLSEEQVERLKELAAQRSASMAELIRQAIDQWIATEGSVSRVERKRRALSVAGRFRSDVDDLAEAHDRHLAEAYEA